VASDVDVCNLALSHLGNEALVQTITPPDGSAEADYCAKFFPVARDMMLEQFPWNFNTRRASLALISENTSGAWAYTYAVPNLMLKAWAVYLPDEIDDLNNQPFIQETDSNGTPVIYSNVEDAVLKYGVRVTDTAKFSPLAVLACSRHLASFLAGPIIKGQTGAKIAEEQLKLAYAATMNAQASDAAGNFTDTPRTNVPASIAARR
jgi:hypothetical protein